MGVQVDDASADNIMAQLLVTRSQDDGLITMYINGPGGSFTADGHPDFTMQYTSSRRCRPSAWGERRPHAAAVLLAAGSEGKRLARPTRAFSPARYGEGVQGAGQRHRRSS